MTPELFSERLRRLPDAFPELKDGGMLNSMFKAVVLPQMIQAAKKDETATRAKFVQIISSVIRALGIDVGELHE